MASARLPTDGEDPGAGREGGAASDAKIKIQLQMRRIPEDFHREDYDPTPYVIARLRSNDREREVLALKHYLEQMDEAMDTVVEEYYKGFNKSIRNFSSILSTMTDSQRVVKDMKVEVERMRNLLGGRKRDLRGLWLKSVMHKQMISILDRIENLKEVSGKLDRYEASKHFLHASHLVMNAFSLVFAEDMLHIGALKDLRSELVMRKTALFERILDELVAQIYLRGAHAALGTATATIDDDVSSDDDVVPRAMRKIRGRKPLPYEKRMSATDIDLQVTEDLTQRADLEDSFLYMQILIESLAVLERLPAAVAAITQRLGAEVSALIEKVTARVDRRERFGRHGRKGRGQGGSEASPLHGHPASLLRLLKPLFDQLIEVLQNHRFIIQVFSKKMSMAKRVPSGHRASAGRRDHSQGRASRPRTNTGNLEDLTSIFARSSVNLGAGVYPMSDPWHAIQQELQRLLCDHLGVQQPQDTSALSDLGDAGDESRLFSFADAAAAASSAEPSADAARPHREAMLVCEPSPYNIVSIYKPLMMFIDDARTEVGDTAHGTDLLRTFLDGFTLQSLIPQIKADCRAKINDIVDGPEAFKPKEGRRGQKYKPSEESRPLLQSSVQIVNLIYALGADALAMPHYVREFTTIIEFLLAEYLTKCTATLREITRDMASHELLNTPERFKLLHLDPLWHKQGSMAPVGEATGSSVAARLVSRVDPVSTREFQDRERLLDGPLHDGARSLTKHELLLDSPSLVMLATLCDSMAWTADKISQLGAERQVINRYRTHSSGTSLYFDRRRSLRGTLSTTPSSPTPSSPGSSTASGSGATSALGHAKTLLKGIGSAMDPLADKFQSLADRCLLQLRTELRCHAFYFLSGLGKTLYVLDSEPREPDSFVVDLNKDLISSEDLLSSFLPPPKVQYALQGLGRLVSDILMTRLKKIQQMNRNGVLRIQRDLAALQQNITSLQVAGDAQFDRVRQYYDLFGLGPDEMVAFIAENNSAYHFTMAELRAMVELQVRSQQAVGNKETLLHRLEKAMRASTQ